MVHLPDGEEICWRCSQRGGAHPRERTRPYLAALALSVLLAAAIWFCACAGPVSPVTPPGLPCEVEKWRCFDA